MTIEQQRKAFQVRSRQMRQSILTRERERSERSGKAVTLTMTLYEWREFLMDRRARSIGESLGWICCYCRSLTRVGGISVDHAKPLARGGSSDRDNLAVCCRRCNKLKGNMLAKDFKALMQALWDMDERSASDVTRRMLSQRQHGWGGKAKKEEGDGKRENDTT